MRLTRGLRVVGRPLGKVGLLGIAVGAVGMLPGGIGNSGLPGTCGFGCLVVGRVGPTTVVVGTGRVGPPFGGFGARVVVGTGRVGPCCLVGFDAPGVDLDGVGLAGVFPPFELFNFSHKSVTDVNYRLNYLLSSWSWCCSRS